MTVRKKLVDAHYYGPSVPATHTPTFSVAPGVRLLPPSSLTQLGQAKAARPSHYAILGAGKTAMDAALWLLGTGIAPEAITWVMPRDSWLVNRQTVQPGEEFFSDSIGGQAAQMECFANATSVQDLFLRLEASGQMLRIYPDHTPSKIVLQLVRAPLPTFSAAMIAYVEAHYADDAHKNRLCGNVPFPHTLAGYVRTMQVNMQNQAQWGQDKTLREWMRSSRQDCFDKLMASVDPGDAEKMAIMGKLRSQAMAAMGNRPRLLSLA